MSAIDFKAHVEKKEDPKGDRVVISQSPLAHSIQLGAVADGSFLSRPGVYMSVALDGKFLPYKKF
jgi:cyanate lyase